MDLGVGCTVGIVGIVVDIVGCTVDIVGCTVVDILLETLIGIAVETLIDTLLGTRVDIFICSFTIVDPFIGTTSLLITGLGTRVDVMDTSFLSNSTSNLSCSFFTTDRNGRSHTPKRSCLTSTGLVKCVTR